MIKKKIGIIGYGSMGSMLLKKFYESGQVARSNLFLATRTAAKFDQTACKGINFCTTNQELAAGCELIFICVKPLEVRAVLEEIIPGLNPGKHLISIAGSVSIKHLAKYFNGKISKVLPAVTGEVQEGVTLVCHQESVPTEDKKKLEELLKNLGQVKLIPEDEFNALSILTSCGPGLIAAIFREYARVATGYTTLSEQEVIDLLKATLYGTAKLLCTGGAGFNTVLAGVATKGGATEVGAEVLAAHLPAVLKEMFEKILARQMNRKATIDEQFTNKY